MYIVFIDTDTKNCSRQIKSKDEPKKVQFNTHNSFKHAK